MTVIELRDFLNEQIAEGHHYVEVVAEGSYRHEIVSARGFVDLDNSSRRVVELRLHSTEPKRITRHVIEEEDDED